MKLPAATTVSVPVLGSFHTTSAFTTLLTPGPIGAHDTPFHAATFFTATEPADVK